MTEPRGEPSGLRAHAGSVVEGDPGHPTISYRLMERSAEKLVPCGGFLGTRRVAFYWWPAQARFAGVPARPNPSVPLL
ncbi:protein of unknown function [Microbacterium sp. Nx66]|nr:protein of unknown function [Microbacterium sp. Nx66]